MANSTLSKHVRSVKSLASEVAAEGRHEDAWQILKDSAASVMVASPGSPNQKMLKLAVRLAEQEKDMSLRTNIMQQAFDEALPTHAAMETTMAPTEWPSTPSLRRPRGEVEFTPDRPNISNGLSRPSTPPCLMRHSRPAPRDCFVARSRALPSELPRVQREQYELPPQANLRGSFLGSGPLGLPLSAFEARETDALPPAGKPPMARAASAPYFVSRPRGIDRFMDEDRTTQRGTSHYTTLGGPRTNQNYGNSLPGANGQFGDRDPWKTSTQAFYQVPDMDPEPFPRRDANFQYVNGEKHQGLATVRQRVRLPAHHTTPFSFC